MEQKFQLQGPVLRKRLLVEDPQKKKVRWSKNLMKTIILFLFTLVTTGIFAHGNQVAYCIMPNGYVRVYVEHWHGDLDVHGLVGNGMSITTTYGITTVTQSMDPSGGVVNTTVNNLPDGGSGVIVISTCQGGANQYNDWAYFDFAPAACNVPLVIRLNSGNTVVLQDACGTLYPAIIHAQFDDHVAPVIVSPDVYVSSCIPIAVNFAANVNDVCDPHPTVTYSIPSGSIFNLGSTIVVVTATDNKGNSSTSTFIVHVNDVIAPTVLTKNIHVQLDANGHATIAAVDIDNGSFDACGIASLTLDKSMFTCANIGVNTVHLKATDINGNSEVAAAIVTVEDKTAPQIICPSNIYRGADSAHCGAFVNYTLPLVSDNCSGGVSIDPIVNGSFETGNYNGWHLSSSNSSFGTFAIGTIGQTIYAGKYIFDYANNVNEYVNSPGLPYTAAPSDGTKMGIFLQLGSSLHSMYQDVTLPLGSLSLCIDLGYKNHSGGFSSTQFIAIELRNPTTNAILTTLFQTVPGSPMVRSLSTMCFDISAYAGQAVRLQMIDASIQNYYLDVFFDNIKIKGGIALIQTAGLPSGSQFPLGTTTNVFSATDSYGNSSSCAFDVTIHDSIAPLILVKNVVLQLDSNGIAFLSVSDVNNGSSDACGIGSLSLDKTSFDCENVGLNSVVLTAIDVNGNSSSANATVTVQDLVSAVVVTQNVTVQLDANGQASVTAAQVNSGSSDACGIASLTLDKTSFDCSNVGDNTVTLTAVDVNGNSSSAIAVVTVEDKIAPSLVCSGDVNITAERNDCTPIVTWNAPVVNDNCSFIITGTHNSGDRFVIGTLVVTYTATDASGNVSLCSFNVTVQPNPLVATITFKSYVGGNNVSCFGQKDGEASVSVEGGCLPYTYAWNTAPVQTAATATGLGAGTYTVTVTDANNTTITKTVTLTQPQVLTADAGANATVYYGYAPKACATLVSTLNGGSTAYSYSWSNGATSANNTVCPASTTTYTLNVTDANGCKASDVAVICAVDVRCEQGGNAIKIGQGIKVLICHTAANKKVETLCVAADAVAAHLAHGDKLGVCGVNASCFQSSKADEGDVAADFVSTSDLTAYPNPFANTTTLVFTANGNERTVVEILDLKGAVVKTAFDANTTEGQVYNVTFDGSSMADAIYIARIVNGSEVQNVKLVLAK